MATCSLRAALSLGLTLGLCRATPTPPQLRVFPKVDEQTATEMISKCAVHGRYEELLVVHGACGMAQGIVPTESFDLGHVNSSEYYVVLEYQPSPADAPREQWLVDVPRTAPHEMSVLHRTDNRYVVSFPRTLVQQLPSGMPLSTEYLVVRERPLRPMASHPVLAAKLARAQANISAENPLIRDALNRITGSALSSTLNMLTTTWNTRNSFAPEAREVADVVGAHFERYGFNVSMEEARPDMSPNVIATLEGTEEPNRWVVIGAHYDSRGVDNQSPTEPSPGANDDGTGTAALMEIARSISESGLTFKYSLMLAAFTGEEQGLFGSRAKAAEQADQGKDILAMFALDMLAYRREGVGPQVGLPMRNHDHVLSLLTGLFFERYVPAVEVCVTTACCSDNTAYHEVGYSSTFIFESCPGLDDPDLHTPRDDMGGPGSQRACPECMDMEQEFPLLTQGAAASAFEILEPIEPSKQ